MATVFLYETLGEAVGTFIGLLTPLITNPIEKLKVELQFRVQTQKPKANYNNFYRGLGAMLLREGTVFIYPFDMCKTDIQSNSQLTYRKFIKNIFEGLHCNIDGSYSITWGNIKIDG